MGPQRLTIDLDGAWCYRAIHGVDRVDRGPGDVDDPVLLQGLPRFLDLCAQLGAPATLFVVGRDLDDSARYADLVAAAVKEGHDVESHSYGHAYDLSRRSDDDIRVDLDRSIAAIARVTGRPPQGFRAPGYNLSPALLDGVQAAGLQWSSSVLPSPAYFAARAAVIAKTALFGRRSASLFGNARDFAPRRSGRQRRHDNGLREFPMSAPLGIPLTGTMLALANDAFAEFVVDRACDTHGTPDDDHGLIDNGPMLELHAADFVDGDLLPDGQPDRRVRLADKLRRIERAARRVVRFAPAMR